MKVLKWMAGATFLLAAVWVGLLSLREPWVTPISGVRLEPSRSILREEDVDPDSAFGLLWRACDLWPAERTKAVVTEFGDLNELDLTGDEEGPAAFREVLTVFEPSLKLCREAVGAGEYQVPTLVPGAMLVRYLAPAKLFGGVFSARARLRASGGDVGGAVDDLACALRLSSLLTCGGTMANHHIACLVVESACRSLREIALQPGCMSPDAARDMVGVLREAEETSDSFAECCRYQWLVTQRTVEAALDSPRKRGRHASRDRYGELLRLHPLVGLVLGGTRGRIMRDLESCFSHLVKAADEPWRRSSVGFGERLFRPERNLLLIQDPLGYMVAGECVPSQVRSREKSEWRRFVLRAMRVFLALRTFEMSHGRPPAILDELTPAILASIPLDPFDGEPIRYGREANGSWRVWSVGPNCRDDGGLDSDWFGVNHSDYVVPGQGWGSAE